VLPSVTGLGDAVSVPWPAAETAPADAAGSGATTEQPAGQDSQLNAPSAQVALSPTRLADFVGARSGDKGDIANLGLWVRSPEQYAWLETYLTSAELKRILPQLADFRIERYALPNLWAVNFVIHGFLHGGAAACTRIDPQGKGLGEFLLSRVIPVPSELVSTGRTERRND
jgi:hypothetical protein